MIKIFLDTRVEGNIFIMRKKGFTLIELLAVIIILAILMIIAVPNILSTLATGEMGLINSSYVSSWYGDYACFIYSSSPWFSR